MKPALLSAFVVGLALGAVGVVVAMAIGAWAHGDLIVDRGDMP